MRNDDSHQSKGMTSDSPKQQKTSHTKNTAKVAKLKIKSSIPFYILTEKTCESFLFKHPILN